MIINSDDLYTLATALEKPFAEIDKRDEHWKCRNNVKVTIEMPRKSVQELDKSLYVGIHHNEDGYEPHSEINLKVFGVQFHIKEKEIKKKS